LNEEGRSALTGWAFLRAGALLMLVKYGLDWAIARFIFGRPWSPANYLVWPDLDLAFVPDLPPEQRRFALTLLAVSLPFVAAGVVLTVRRLRAIGLPVGLVVMFFVPWVNLLFFATLVVLPDGGAASIARAVAHPRRPAGGGIVEPGGAWRRAATPAFAVVAGSAATLALAWLGVNVLKSYGFGVFVGAPFLLGLLTVVLAGQARPRRLLSSLGLAGCSLLLTSAALMLLSVEGAICVLMALPIGAVLAFFGALVGHACVQRAWSARGVPGLCLCLLSLAPVLMAAESASEPAPPLRAVVTAVVVDASPDVVWRSVVSFPPIPEPGEWYFRAGVACPLRAEIHGSGAGAVRHCIFTTGRFVEPIELFEPPRLLRFDVTDQPPPMVEWSPYAIHPPHLDGYLVSRKGQFRLEPLPGGGTLLEGTTWYTNRMWPAPYWSFFSDALIRAIHRRVLDHIRRVAES
jgi:hypothetical protein